MQNKAKFLDAPMNVTAFITREYENKSRFLPPEKQSQTKPNKPKFKKAKMNVSAIITEDYEKMSNCPIYPKQSQTNPIKANNYPAKMAHNKSKYVDIPAQLTLNPLIKAIRKDLN